MRRLESGLLILDADGARPVLENGDTLIIEGASRDGHLVGRVEKAPRGLRRAWRRFALWTIRLGR